MSLKQYYHARFESVDFRGNARAIVQQVNSWIAGQTNNFIRSVVPPDGFDKDTRLALVNAIYLKAACAGKFPEANTTRRPFHVRGGAAVEAPTIRKQDPELGYQKRDGLTAVTIPYIGKDLQLLVLLPDRTDGLPELEAKLSVELLEECLHLPSEYLDLSMPKFKLEPATAMLGEKMQALGMKSAFDVPRGSANFSGIAPRTSNDYLAISQIFHQAFYQRRRKRDRSRSSYCGAGEATVDRDEA
jgi:serpin B